MFLKMKWHYGILFITILYLEEVSSQMDCNAICNKNSKNVETPKSCHCSKITKRDILEDFKKKMNKDKMMKNLKIWPTEGPKKINWKNLANFQSNKERAAGKLPFNTPSEMYKDLQNRVKELRMRMSGNHHQFKSRANFDDKIDVKEQYRKSLKDLQEKFKNQSLKNRIGIGASKLGSVHNKNNEEKSFGDSKSSTATTSTTTTTTTEKSTVSRRPIVVLMPSSSSTTAKPKESVERRQSSITALERLKEKQKETVMKIKDKIFIKDKADKSENEQ